MRYLIMESKELPEERAFTLKIKVNYNLAVTKNGVYS